MSWVNRWKGKNVLIDIKNPAALGVCDESGFDFNRKDLVQQMKWSGDNLVWSGLMVGRPYLDAPSEQNRPPLVKADPRPVKDPRLPGNNAYTDPNGNQVLSNAQLTTKLQNVNWGN
jgi:hypothetical protein